MNKQPDINRMTPIGNLGYVDTRVVLTSIAATCEDAEKIISIRISSGALAKAGPWEPVEQHNELIGKVTIGDYQGSGWVVTAAFVRAEVKGG